MKKDANNKNKNSFSLMEEEVLNFWKENKIFEKSVEREAPKGDYVFYDGPPFATGTPHYGHIAASIMKDAVPRYWTMNGYRVERKWGWDCHGLPIENIVEKELGSKTKKDLEKIGVEKFNALCRKRVLGYVEEWENVISRLGRWVDMKNCYRTMDKIFMESVWWVFKQLWDKGLIYKGFRSMHICPRCETTLSQSEVAEGYKDVKDLSAVAKFELVDEPGTYVLAWTTTPWTLIGNVALAINEKINYSTVENDGAKYKVASDLVEKVFNGKDYQILNNSKGKELIGKQYKPLFPYFAEQDNLENAQNGWKIYHGDFVSTEEGTGVVHIAPAFGEDDMSLGKENNLPFIQHVGMNGIISKEAKDFAGLSVKPKGEEGEKDAHMKTDVEIIKYLAKQGALFHKEKYEHSYPHCWRCDTPLLNYATSSWFVNVVKIKDDLLKNAEEINWSPGHIKKGRWGQWLQGVRDWSISRQRFWASVMPIWECGCGEQKVFGGTEELEKLSGEKISDLHKDVVDKITFSCEKCGGEMKRIPDVLDTWFDSGSMPYAQMHYPFENKKKFEENFPAEFIAEGQDQCRAWFYYLHVIATGIKNSRAFNNVIVNGIALAEDGKKMSKKLKNYPDPSNIFEKYTADAIRYYILTSPLMLADNLNFAEDGVKEAFRKVNMLLWNVVKFYDMFTRGKEPNRGYKENSVSSENVLDKWIVAKLNQLIAETSSQMEKYNLPKATRPIAEFIDDLSTWYIRRSRDRFKSGEQKDKDNALRTAGFVLVELSKVLAPFTPFLAEQVWQKITENNFKNADKSVHLESWPSVRGKEKNEEEEIISKMETARKIVELGLARRDEAGVKVRQPLLELKIKNKELSNEYKKLIADEVNVKNIVCEKGSGKIDVELDTELNDDLKTEGAKREIIRFINSGRKKMGLTISDGIEVYWDTDGKFARMAFDEYNTEISQETLSVKLSEGKPKREAMEVGVNGEKLFLYINKI